MIQAPRPPIQPDSEIGAWALDCLQTAVAIDSASDERSTTVPTTPGQAELARSVGTYFERCGAAVERDDFANVIATIEGSGLGVGQRPVALLVHLDTARGTTAVPQLEVAARWQGDRVPYARNDALQVEIATYPSLASFVGQDLVFGPGDAPFGLDDKLGLTHLMTLARLLAENPGIDHPPLMLIGRPDEEVGRMDAIIDLAAVLAERGVDFGYTVDGILPYEINVENFNASQAAIRFEGDADDEPPGSPEFDAFFSLRLGGVNTHGCTAKAEGYRAATRLCAELVELLVRLGWAPDRIAPVRFASDELRDCDAQVHFGVAPGVDPQEADRVLREAVAAIVDPHAPRGASWRVEPSGPVDVGAASATWSMLDYVASLIADNAGFPVLAEESDGHQGYSNPYRARPDGTTVLLDVRVRDFLGEGLLAREAHLASLLSDDATMTIVQQYANMASRMVQRADLVSWPAAAARTLGIDAEVLPIRGGTGVDPFLDQGVPIANLGTGYFAPESEKELTTIQHMVGHAKWLFALVQVIAAARSEN